MNIGQIVCSRAGSDKGSFLAVVAVAEGRVLVCDGKRYKLSSPKSKNPRHLAPTSETLNIDTALTDKALRKAIAVFRSKLK